MGMAARMGDPTAHGGTIVAGLPTVLIGGMPAARMGDMHVCPMVTPGVPPIPHVGGPIAKGSAGVLIGGMPAARVGDMAVCVGPPSSIIMGCPTVMIGEVGSGGGGAAGAGGAGGASSATEASITSAALAEIDNAIIETQDGTSADAENHFLDVSFVDKKKLSITGYHYTVTAPSGNECKGILGEDIQMNGLEDADHDISLKAIVNAQWDVEEAEVGDEVKLIVTTVGIEDGTPAELTVYVKDSNYTDHAICIVEAAVDSDEVEVLYTLEIDDYYLEICADKIKSGRYSQPLFFYKVKIDEMIEQSGLLIFKDWKEFVLNDSDNNPMEDLLCEVSMPNGTIEHFSTDSSGKIRVENIAPHKISMRVLEKV